MGVQVPPAAPKIMTKLLLKVTLNLFLFFFIVNYTKSKSALDYSFSHIVDSCQITKKIPEDESEEKKKIVSGRQKYVTCMNFIMALSSAMNRRCINLKNQKISPRNAMTFADLSSVKSTTELINVILDYSNKYPHFLNQIAWLHASKAISQKWPCKQSN